MCLTDILALAKKGHSAFSRSEKNGKVYFQISIWDNDEKNKFGQDVSIQLNPKKDTSSERSYVGNGKIEEYKPTETINTPETPLIVEESTDDLPF
jgi:hypothetical protein